MAQHGFLRWLVRHLRRASLLAAVAASLPVPATAAQITIDEQAGVIRLQATDASLRAAITALQKRYGIEIAAGADLLDDRAEGTYSGSLDAVVGQLLTAYNYVAMRRAASRGGNLEIRIIGRAPGQAAPRYVPPEPTPGTLWRKPPAPGARH